PHPGALPPPHPSLHRNASAITARSPRTRTRAINPAPSTGETMTTSTTHSRAPAPHQLWTRAVRGGLTPDPTTGAIETPIHQNTTYAQPGIGLDAGYTYSRDSNPTVAALETALAELDAAPNPAVCFATGLAAVAGLLITLTSAGDHIVCGDVVYGGTTRLLADILSRYNVQASFVDTSNPENVRLALTPRTKLVLIETPANPTLKLSDIAAISAICRE